MRSNTLRETAKSTRRRFLGRVGLGIAAAAFPFIRPARAARSLRVSTFGGYFERNFAAHVYPAFMRATGIAVESVEQPEGAQFLLQLAAANRAGAPPMDICCNAAIDVLRGRDQNVWAHLKAERIPNIAQVAKPYAGIPGVLDNVAAMSWYMTFVVNPAELKKLPDSWTALWEPHPNAWGIESGSVSPILEIAAATYFGGVDLLSHTDGIDKVIDKIAEMKSNVKLWWQDEGTMQTALVNDDVVGGIYMHDTAMVMIRNGTPVRSIFPREGAVSNTNYWCQLSASTKIEECQEFLNFSCTPEAQELIARYVGSAPVMDRSRLDLTDQEFAAVATSAQTIPTNTEARYKYTDYIERKFIQMVTS